jgi:anti-sigma B factor antagonist
MPPESTEPLPFEIRRDDRPGTPVLTVQGDIDLATADAFEAAIVALGDGEAVVDLLAVDFMDSTGLRALLRATTGRATPLRLVIEPDGAVARLLAVAGVEPRFDVHESLASALAA